MAPEFSEFRDKRITVIGLAREGVALCHYLCARGARVTVSDGRDATALAATLAEVADLPLALSLGGNRVEDVLGADQVFVSPGVPSQAPMLVAARARGIPIRSEPELFFALCPAPILAITGSAGKTTTTSLCGVIGAQSGKPTWVGGNIGRPLLGQVEQIRPDDLVVVELSSFQLERLGRSPHVAVWTNLMPDHLDRHGSITEYAAAKAEILRYQKPDDWAVLNADDATVRAYQRTDAGRRAWFSLARPVERGAWLADGCLWLAWDGAPEPVAEQGELKIPGRHNVANALAAIVATRALGLPVETIRAGLLAFRGVKNRLEWVAEIAGVAYYNDSIATTPDRALTGLRAFDRPVVLLAGGRNKNLDMTPLGQAVQGRCRAVICFGETGPVIAAAARQAQSASAGAAIHEVAGLADAVTLAGTLARPGDVVLLSPACTSFDQFSDYEARGQAFIDLVRGRHAP